MVLWVIAISFVIWFITTSFAISAWVWHKKLSFEIVYDEVTIFKEEA